jgi:hypothetical protein
MSTNYISNLGHKILTATYMNFAILVNEVAPMSISREQ